MQEALRSSAQQRAGLDSLLAMASSSAALRAASLCQLTAAAHTALHSLSSRQQACSLQLVLAALAAEVVPACTGADGAAALQQAGHVILRCSGPVLQVPAIMAVQPQPQSARPEMSVWDKLQGMELRLSSPTPSLHSLFSWASLRCCKAQH